MKTLSARLVLQKAIENGAIKVDDPQNVSDYLAAGAAGKSGFIVDGDIEKFTNYFVKYAGGGCAMGFTDFAAGGGCGFQINGDFGYAWIKRFLDSAQSGASGFQVLME